MKSSIANTPAKARHKKQRVFKWSAQALARVGRPCLYPEAKILAQRAEITYKHAYKIVTGRFLSPKLDPMLVGIRAELAAKGITPNPAPVK